MKLSKYIKKVGPTKFAEQTGLSISTAKSYSSGRRKPNPSTAERIEKALNGRVKLHECYQ